MRGVCLTQDGRDGNSSGAKEGAERGLQTDEVRGAVVCSLWHRRRAEGDVNVNRTEGKKRHETSEKGEEE
jgi:hypothetical protein